MSMAQSAVAPRSVPNSGFAASESMAGLAAVVLTILGLAHVAPLFLVAIAAIAAGIAMMLRGATLASEFAALMSVNTAPTMAGASAWSIEFLSGLAGIILGILALLQLQPAILIAAAVIALGGGMTMSSAVSAQLGLARTSAAAVGDGARYVFAEAASSSAATQALSGLAAVVLGILSLAGFSSVVLILVALLELGAFIVVNGSTFGGMLVGLFGR